MRNMKTVKIMVWGMIVFRVIDVLYYLVTDPSMDNVIATSYPVPVFVIILSFLWEIERYIKSLERRPYYVLQTEPTIVTLAPVRHEVRYEMGENHLYDTVSGATIVLTSEGLIVDLVNSYGVVDTMSLLWTDTMADSMKGTDDE